MTKLSRSKIELSLECPRCFWLDMKQKIKRPPPMPYTINNAVDYLLKQEFDVHREKGTAHPVMKKHAIDAVPFNTPEINKWRHNFTGVQHQHAPTDFLVYGAVDDLWVNSDGRISVVDYKATGANQHNIYDSYRRQMEIYQWLLRQNGLDVSPTGYFVFAKVNKGGGFGFGTAALSFDLIIEPLEGDNSWVEKAIKDARKIFDLEKSPEANPECEYCIYAKNTTRI
ncbi:MAG: hypothetical protein A3B25_02880 [Candidatus Ryanbacteria bacterium RIFCSPLOWO2_01_FULL_48_26]|uniref:PD-(D/E)XK endonuclease-like domain-containing protein n=1 Tax=Candidatus Ryanbacteria bacterium RIFCSPLOWO2_01_FULL_48_26 TaxID=1802126 RepID=A0A1G2GX42_9BACT|nr:MAG: hypothetical protein A3B25_02880 [Candidatus Ryanbacteria bacterium RIFCSPLOWO2_01_FULL_48_26]